MRAIIRVRLDLISDSCGYGVPLLRYEGERTQMDSWADNRIRTRGADSLLHYQQEHNLESIDGLPGLDCDFLQASSQNRRP